MKSIRKKAILIKIKTKKILESLKNSCSIIKNEKYVTHTGYCLFAAECSLMTVRKESSFNKEKKNLVT